MNIKMLLKSLERYAAQRVTRRNVRILCIRVMISEINVWKIVYAVHVFICRGRIGGLLQKSRFVGPV